MEQKKHYLVYKTTNLVNGKIYIGKHETDDFNDGYLGSGKILKLAIEKYGAENFKREILFECSTREEMNAKEAELVNDEFLKRDDVYNLKEGGEGGFDYINTHGLTNNSLAGKNGNRVFRHKYLSDNVFNQRMRKTWAGHLQLNRQKHPDKFSKQGDKNSFYGKHHTEEAKKKIGKKNRVYQMGKGNNQFGTVWIYNESLKKNMKVKKELVDGFLNEGWKLGRRMSF